jgi:casein kinase I homolog HRR25
MEKKVK